MNLRKKIQLFLCAASLMFTVVPLLANNPIVVEDSVYNIRFNRSVASFDSLITAFEGQALENAEIGGFVFVPYWINSTGNEEPKPAGEIGVSGPGQLAGQTYKMVYTFGFRVFLSYFETNAENERDIKFFGFEEVANADSVVIKGIPPTSVDPDHFFKLEAQIDQPGFRFTPEDLAQIAEIPEMDLTYLSIDDYFYLAVEDSYYPGGQAPANRELIIQRALVGQTFDLTNEDSTNINRYRTLSFRPGGLSINQGNSEALMAFKYGYYCPPYWQQDGAGASSSSSSSSSLTAQKLSFSPNNNPPNDSIDVDNIMLSVPTERIMAALGGFLEDQLSKRRRTVADFGETYPEYCAGTIIDFSTLSWPLLVLLLVIFLVGLAVGRLLVP